MPEPLHRFAVPRPSGFFFGARPVEARVTVSGTVGRQARPAAVRRAGKRGTPVRTGRETQERRGGNWPRAGRTTRLLPGRQKPGSPFRRVIAALFSVPLQAATASVPGLRRDRSCRSAARPARKTARRYSKKANKGPAITAWARSASWIPMRWSMIACSPAGGMLSPTISRIVLSLRRLSSARAHR